MKKAALMIFAAMLFFSAEALAKKPMAKSPAVVRDTVVAFLSPQELRLVNPKPIEIGYRKWGCGSVCTSQIGAQMQVMGAKNGKVLLLYVPAPDETTINCPPGALFMIGARDFLRLKALSDKKKAAEDAEKALVQQILSER